jgi:hypothetical protein
MALIREKLRPHVALVDTNILWCKDKGPAVNPEFDESWDELRKDFPLELAVPSVVRGELLFQQTTSCHKLVDKLSEDTKEIAGITAYPHKPRVTKASVATQVSTKLDRWLKQKSATLVPTPIASIDWQKMCEAAVWRLPPFTFDPKTPETEKGFRDALIFETVVDFANRRTTAVDIAFICNDFLLRTTVSKALLGNKRFKAFEDLGEFGSYLKLLREQLNSAFIARIVRRAMLKFFEKNNPECLWARESLSQKLCSQKQVSEPPEDQVGGLTMPAFSLGTAANFQQLGLAGGSRWTIFEGAIFRILRPEFQSLSGERKYHWRNEVVLLQRYQSASVAKLSPETKVKAVRFQVFWSAEVRADAKFHSIVFERFEVAGVEFRNLTPADQSTFGITPTSDDIQPKLPSASG